MTDYISCYRIYFSYERALASECARLIEEMVMPDSIAVGRLTEGHIFHPEKEYIELIFQSPPDKIALMTVFSMLGAQPQDYVSETLSYDDWVTRSLRQLDPIHAGDFYIHGTHVTPPSHIAPYPLIVDAGMAFGTGHHETTAGCLEILSEIKKYITPRHIIDLGTGTAILAMAAVKLWKKNVLATDIDPIAVHVSKHNTMMNNTHPWIHLIQAAGTQHSMIRRNAPYDLIIANILARPLMGMAKDITAITARKGYVLLSGILWEQRLNVLAIYRQHGFTMIKAHRIGGWCCFLLQSF